ncbi:hypothetical protein WJX72_001934 [[Myrmecia] bisecta]|uniref:Poly [ADP-ribose] polymerase n=1 Tax=[Myrmecia] bisecta TaxID=41462 RepID=A0AAW1Q0I0_9CHLO
MKGKPPPSASKPVGDVDPAAGKPGFASSHAVIDHEGEPCDVKLSYLDLSKNMDKYYVLQALEDMTTGETLCYGRWGKTGRCGSAMVWEAPTADDAVAWFRKKFRAKTGVAWEDRASHPQPKPNKYSHLIGVPGGPGPAAASQAAGGASSSASSNNFAAGATARMETQIPPGTGFWKYWVDDGVDGKATGWYPYDLEAAGKVEDLFAEWIHNPQLKLDSRVVASGQFEYRVELKAMTQQNVVHSNRKVRKIRRVVNKDLLASQAVVSVAPQAGAAPLQGLPGAALAAAVVDDCDAMLNQANITANANKFYVVQLLRDTTEPSTYYVFTRWGRVGDQAKKGTQRLFGPFNRADAETLFKGRFLEKTGIPWAARANATPKAGLYELVEIDLTAKPKAGPAASTTVPAVAIQYPPSQLAAPTQELIELIFDMDMFKEAMADLSFDVEQCPLGNLTQGQVARGQAILDQLQDAIKQQADVDELVALSSKFYQIIPHSFPRNKRPTVIANQAMVNAKVDLCNVLSDVEVAQGMLDESAQNETALAPLNPLDERYQTLRADLRLLDEAGEEYCLVKQYAQATGGLELLQVWAVERSGEDSRFAAHAALDNRRLLWHGTNIAVVAAVLRKGLRIMPHSGGRVGKGIYLASENSKSAGYVTSARRNGNYVCAMFLAEAALGKEYSLLRDDSSLRAPPSGFDSVVARGRTEPDPAKDAVLALDGRSVIVPQGKPIPMPAYGSSSFSQSEYLLYQESQQRIRYIATFKFSSRGSWH